VGGSGQWGACSAKEPEIETCDGVDNDCNGKVDDGLFQSCGDCNLGYSVCQAGAWSACQTDYIPDSFQLIGTLRDFHANNYGGDYPHPDFENANGDDKNIIADLIGDDHLPVYKPLGDLTTPTTHGKKWFDMWYRDTPNYNQSKEFPILLARKPGVMPPTYVYDNPSFFPLDGELFGAEGNPHNFSFTYELHSTFYYRGGEHFFFRGDDDLYVFVDGHLLINLGGVHGAEGQDIDIDAAVSQFGLKKCTPYQIDLFFAERHTNASSFRIETSLILLAL
jgi:fibro-slime domain-containing protein